MAHTLEQWLQHIERLHPRSMELGLDRVRRVHGALGSPLPAPLVVTVAGTNGKGSCVAWMEALCQAAGLRTLAYTSPHLQRYNERIRIDAAPISDAELIAAFERVDGARGEVPITFFEFGTLAAFVAGASAGPDIALLEVGLGGRLDAVNILDADVAVLTSIGLDHTDWLGPDRDSIGAEKAGIFRSGRPAVTGERALPATVVEVADSVGARLLRIGEAFDYERGETTWSWHSAVTQWRDLPLPGFGGDEQYANVSCALAALEQLGRALRLTRETVVAALATTLPARTQSVSGHGNWLLDVAHNREAAQALAANLAARPHAGRTLGVAGMMRGKPAEAFAATLAPCVDAWWVTAADNERALPAAECAAAFAASGRPVQACADVEAALASAVAAARAEDRILVTGSFLIVGAALDYISRAGRGATG